MVGCGTLLLLRAPYWRKRHIHWLSENVWVVACWLTQLLANYVDNGWIRAGSMRNAARLAKPLEAIIEWYGKLSMVSL